MEVSGQVHAPAALPQYLLDRRLGGSQSQSGYCGEEKNLLSVLGIKPQFLGSPDHSLDAILTSLSSARAELVSSFHPQTSSHLPLGLPGLLSYPGY
jgi:hypothetical protein